MRGGAGGLVKSEMTDTFPILAHLFRDQMVAALQPRSKPLRMTMPRYPTPIVLG